MIIIIINKQTKYLNIMKHKLLKSLLLLSALVVGIGNVWADDITFTQVTSASDLGDGDEVLVVSTFSSKSIAMLSTVSTTSTKYMTVSEVTISNTNTITLPDNSSITVWTVKKSGDDYSFKSGNNYVICNTTGTTNSANVSTTLDDKAKYTIEKFSSNEFQFKNKSNTNKYLKGGNSGDRFAHYASDAGNTAWIKLFKKPVDNRAATTVTLNDGYSTSAYIGELVVSPSLNKVSTTSADIDGATVEWSSTNTAVATINASTGDITLVAPGTTTIKASYKGDASYKPSDASYTLTVYGSYTTIADVHAAVTTTETNAKYTFANEFITYIDEAKKNIYVSDGTNGMVLFSGTPYTSDALVVGAKLVGGVYTRLQDFNGTVEFKNIPNDDLAALVNGSETVTASIKTIDAIAKANQSTLVKLENVTYDGSTDPGVFTDGTNSIKYGKKFNSKDLTGDATYDITGIVILISNELYIAPRSDSDITLKSTKETPTSAWYTDSGKGTALSTIAINKADGVTSFFFDTNSTGTVSYESTVTSVATIAADGTITPVGYGTTIIKATTAANSSYYTSNASFTLTVKDDDVDVILPGNITYSSSSTGYCAWSSVSNLWSGATYAGNTNNVSTKIQMKADNSVGIVVTGNVGRVKKVSVTWNSTTTTGRTLYIYGTNTPYTTVAVGAKEEELGSFGSKNSGVSELTINAAKNYGYIRIAVTGGAVYLDKIQIEWDKTIFPAEVSDVGYATFAAPVPLDFSSTTIKAYIAKANGSTGVTFTQKNKIPADTGVLLIKSGGATEAIPVLVTTEDDVTGNVFHPGTGAAVATDDGTNYNYILNNKNNILGFYRAAGQKVATSRAYISIPKSIPVKEFITLPGFEDDADAINEVNGEGFMVNGPVYDLSGRLVQKPSKGLYIVNGKKVLF